VCLLIVKTSSMGDVIHALPLAADIARAVPRVTLVWLVEEGFAAIPARAAACQRFAAAALKRWRHALLESAAQSEIVA
jgi:heptosyltransferase-1